MDWILRGIESKGKCTKDMSILDVACGTGIMTRALADKSGASKVIGLDATQGMLEVAKKQSDIKGGCSIQYVCDDAVKMPFGDCDFDLVTTRLAIHHFHDPREQVAEMVRVCKKGGRVVIVDITSPSGDSKAADELNRLERLRDPSHTRSLTIENLQGLLLENGLEVMDAEDKVSTFDNPMDLQQWMSATETPANHKKQIEDSINAELRLITQESESQRAGQSQTGMFPYTENGKTYFIHKYAIVQGVKVT